MVLAAGRIWWITKKAQVILEQDSKRRYRGIIAIMLVHIRTSRSKLAVTDDHNSSNRLESGLLYPVCMVIYLSTPVASIAALRNGQSDLITVHSTAAAVLQPLIVRTNALSVFFHPFCNQTQLHSYN